MVVRALIVSILLIVSSCKDKITDNDKSNTEVSISVYEKSCTEVWLDVEYDNVGYKREISISLQEQENLKTNIANDTILYLNGFEANQNYDLAIELPETETHSGYKTTLNVSTLPLTNQNFTWEKYYFGEHSTSAFYDVEIIDENNIWVVGEVFMNDSLGGLDPLNYNFAKYNGQYWKLDRIKTEYKGSEIVPPINGIKYFTQDNIWLAASLPIFWNGIRWNVVNLRDDVSPEISVNKIWAEEPSRMYFAGLGGNIVHYNGTQWHKVATGTSLPINDIHGAYNKKTGEWEILATSGSFSVHGGELFSIEGLRATRQSLTGMTIEETLGGVWFIPNIKYIFGSGWGIYVKEKLSEDTWQIWHDVVKGWYINSIGANGLNDIFLAGGHGQVLHFNGKEVKSYIDEINFTAGNILSLKVKGDLVVGVGTDAHQAVIVIGKR